MRFKLDENLPGECVLILRQAGFEARNVAEEELSGADDATLFRRCQNEARIIVTLDLDFANVRAYPPGSHPGVIVFRPNSQHKALLIDLLRRLMPVLKNQSPEQQLWIVEDDRIGIRK